MHSLFSVFRATVLSLLLAASGRAGAETQAPAASGAAGRRPIALDDFYAIKDVGGVTLSPDGRSVVYVVREIDRAQDDRISTIWRVPVAGGVPQQLTARSRVVSAPQFAPDGRYLAFLSQAEDESQVFVLPTAGGEAFKVTALPGGVSDFDWSPDSRRLVLVSGEVKTEGREGKPVTVERSSKEATPNPIVVTRLRHKEDALGYLTRQRDHLYLADIGRVLDSSGDRPAVATPLTSGPYEESFPAWSPDGRTIAFASNRSSEPDDNYDVDIWTIDVVSGQIGRLTSDPGEDTQPEWSPDGRRIAYMNTPADPPIYSTIRAMIVDAGGGMPLDLTTRFDRHVNDSPKWAPDGQSVFVPMVEGGRTPLVRIGLDGRRTTILDGEVAAFAVGSDRVIAAMDTPRQASDVYVAAADGRGSPLNVGLVNEPFFRTLQVSMPEAIHFTSRDGTPVEAWVVKPPDFDASRKYPLIMRLHGGPVDHHTDSFWFEIQYLASLGNVMLLPNPRGSTGYGEAFSRAIAADWGNKDYDDVMAAVDAVLARGYVDPKRMGVGGWSYGGLLTNYVITKTDRFAAAVSGASEVDMSGAFGADDLRREWLGELGPPWERPELYRRLSPIANVKNIVTPTLVLCGEKDLRCPLPQSEQLYLALRTLGRPTALIIYPGQTHEFRAPSYLVDRLRRYGLWYGKYLQGQDVDPTYDISGTTPTVNGEAPFAAMREGKALRAMGRTR